MLCFQVIWALLRAFREVKHHFTKLRMWKMAVQPSDVRSVCTREMDGLTFISLLIIFLFYPCAPAMLWPPSSNMAQLWDLFHSTIICQVMQLFHNQPPLHNHKDWKSQGRYTLLCAIFQMEGFRFSPQVTLLPTAAPQLAGHTELKKKKQT